MNAIRISCTLWTAAALAAQVPTDSAVILETSAPGSPNYAFADVFGRGTTTVAGQNVFLTPPPVSVATDPTVATDFFFMSTTTFPGTWRSSVGPLGRIQGSVWGAWLRVAGQRVEVGATRVVTLRNGIVEWCPKPANGVGLATTLFQLTGAIDLAIAEPFVYVASNNGGAPSPLVECNLLTGAQRTIGNYSDVRCIAVSPVGPELCLGLATGDLQRIDAATGVVTSNTPTGLGPLVAVGYTRYGSLVYADQQTAWSEFAPGAPIYASNSSIVDLGVATVPVASSTPFGEGCGAAAAIAWDANGAPTLGNASFSLGLRNGVPTSFAILALGDSRSVSSVLGAQLPLDLQVVGAPGCRLLVDPLFAFAQPTDIFGEADQALPIPATPTLAGLEWSAQWIQPDAAIGPLGLATSRGLACLVQ